MYVKSPLNYIGNKYRLLDKILPLFPADINVCVDLFCGGCDIAANVDANAVRANDINYHLIEILKEFQRNDTEELLARIDTIIKEWNLTKENKAAYERFRAHYNATKNDPIELYVLVCYSFNYQFRFNSQHDFNNPFGKNRSSFNSRIRENLILFLEQIQNVTFSSDDFTTIDMTEMGTDDFVYADPPYLLSCASYNDGKRGFKGWTEKEENELLAQLTRLDSSGVRFALSNVIEHKGKTNELLLDWANGNDFTIHEINFDYNNCNYQTKRTNAKTREVLVTNY